MSTCLCCIPRTSVKRKLENFRLTSPWETWNRKYLQNVDQQGLPAILETWPLSPWPPPHILVPWSPVASLGMFADSQAFLFCQQAVTSKLASSEFSFSILYFGFVFFFLCPLNIQPNRPPLSPFSLIIFSKSFTSLPFAIAPLPDIWIKPCNFFSKGIIFGNKKNDKPITLQLWWLDNFTGMQLSFSKKIPLVTSTDMSACCYLFSPFLSSSSTSQHSSNFPTVPSTFMPNPLSIPCPEPAFSFWPLCTYSKTY